MHINGEQSREDVCDEVIRNLDPIMYPCLLGEAPEDVLLLGDVKGEEEQVGEGQKGGEDSEQASQPEFQTPVSCPQTQAEGLQEQALSCQNQQSKEQAAPCQAVLEQDIPPETQQERKSCSKPSNEPQERRSSSQQQQEEVKERRPASRDQKSEEQYSQSDAKQPLENQQAQSDCQE